MSSDSCLISKLSHYTELSGDDRETLASLEKDEKQYERQNPIFDEGERLDNLYVVKSGWACGYCYLPNGARQILNVFTPGDILGIANISFTHSPNSAIMLTEGTLCPFPRKHLSTVFESSPKLTGLLFSVANMEAYVLADRLKAVGKLKAEARLALLFLELQTKLQITTGEHMDEFRFPFDQQQIGDAIGLTSVHVSRSMAGMVERRLIDRSQGRIRILNGPELSKMCDFTNRVDALATDWHPK